MSRLQASSIGKRKYAALIAVILVAMLFFKSCGSTVDEPAISTVRKNRGSVVDEPAILTESTQSLVTSYMYVWQAADYESKVDVCALLLQTTHMNTPRKRRSDVLQTLDGAAVLQADVDMPLVLRSDVLQTLDDAAGEGENEYKRTLRKLGAIIAEQMSETEYDHGFSKDVISSFNTAMRRLDWLRLAPAG